MRSSEGLVAFCMGVFLTWSSAPAQFLASEDTEGSNYFASHGAAEASLEFDFQVEFSSKRLPKNGDAVKAIENQVLHLFGPIAAAKLPAVPKTDHKITNVQISQKSGKGKWYVAKYHYRGTIVVAHGSEKRYGIVLPIRPESIFRDSFIVGENGEQTNPCTDSHYDTEDDFWYFWNPDQKDCPLKEGVHYARLDGVVERRPNTKLTYPEYARLVDESGKITFDVFIGLAEAKSERDPFISKDSNAATFLQHRNELLKLGFTERKLTADEVRALVGLRRVKNPPTLFLYEKKTKRAGLAIRLFFGATGIEEDSESFHVLLRQTLASRSVLIYGGHSGLGDYLSLKSIEKASKTALTPNPKRYQIYYFDSCSSYPYYNADYFARKQTTSDPKGTKNLDILTNGLATGFDVGAETELVLIRAIEEWAMGGVAKSYQKLSELMERDNLFGVNGDEDNPTSAP